MEESGIEGFRTVFRSIQVHLSFDIKNFFVNNSTNASAESFNAKVKSDGMEMYKKDNAYQSQLLALKEKGMHFLQCLRTMEQRNIKKDDYLILWIMCLAATDKLY